MENKNIRVNVDDKLTDVIDRGYYDEMIETLVIMEGKEFDDKAIKEIKDRIQDGINLTIEAAKTLGDKLYVREEDNLLYVYEKIEYKNNKYIESVSVYLTPYKFEVDVNSAEK